MKKYLSIGLLLTISFALVSWGYKGHRITALIAENYLTSQAKAAVKDLLGNESLADVSTWADDVRNDPQYKNTASWHYLNLPLGLSYEKFGSVVYSQSIENVLTAIQRCEGTLSDEKTSKEQKREALKFLVHFIGDVHQPMHVSRAEDRGGNTIQVQFDGKGTNLHALWDSGLIDYSGLSESQLVAKVIADWIRNQST
jgi:hypothetical protein